MRISRKKVLGLAITLTLALAATTLLRESGFVQVTLYRGVFVAEDSKWKSAESPGPDFFAFRERLNKEQTRSITYKSFWGLGLTPHPVRTEPIATRGQGRLAVLLRDRLAARFGDDPMEIYVMQADLTGPYWTPFKKSGRCYYGIGLGTGPDGATRGVLSGDLEFEVVGLLSTRDLQEVVAELIVARAVRD